MNKTKRNGRTTKKLLLIIGAAVLLLAAALTGRRVYTEKQLEKLQGMSARDCLNAVLAGNDDAVITIGIIDNGTVDWNVYRKDGTELPPALHTYEIGSLTKTVTASMTAAAIADGKVRLDDPIDAYLALPGGKTYLTIRELLTHTSGYKEYYYESPMAGNFLAGRNSFCGITDEMLFKRIAGVDVSAADRSWRYSNFDYAVLGQVLETVYGGEYTEMANAFLSEQGMTGSHISTGTGDLGHYWDWEKEDAYMPAGAIVSNIEDMLVYAQRQLDGAGVFAGTHAVCAEVSATPEDYARLDMRVDAMGMGWIVDKEHGFIWHNGATAHYNCYVGFCLETQTAVVVLSNLSPNDRIPATIIGIKLLKELQK